MAPTEGKKKKPPTFHYLPKNRAKQLKKSWVEDRKLRSKWKAQKRREGLTKQTNELVEIHEHKDTSVDPQSDIPLSCLGESSTTAPSHDKPSLRDLRKAAYATGGSHLSSHSDRSGNVAHRREKGQPNMKLRMNVLLEKIKRDFS